MFSIYDVIALILKDAKMEDWGWDGEDEIHEEWFDYEYALKEIRKLLKLYKIKTKL